MCHPHPTEPVKKQKVHVFFSPTPSFFIQVWRENYSHERTVSPWDFSTESSSTHTQIISFTLTKHQHHHQQYFPINSPSSKHQRNLFSLIEKRRTTIMLWHDSLSQLLLSNLDTSLQNVEELFITVDNAKSHNSFPATSSSLYNNNNDDDDDDDDQSLHLSDLEKDDDDDERIVALVSKDTVKSFNVNKINSEDSLKHLGHFSFPITPRQRTLLLARAPYQTRITPKSSASAQRQQQQQYPPRCHSFDDTIATTTTTRQRRYLNCRCGSGCGGGTTTTTATTTTRTRQDQVVPSRAWSADALTKWTGPTETLSIRTNATKPIRRLSITGK
jgi:hypothetical protein